MSLLLWNYDDYSVYVNSIDNEHKLLFTLLNEVGEALHIDGIFHDQIVNDRLGYLSQAIKKHFESEESLLLLNFYPEFNAHKLQHTFLLDRLDKFASQYKKRKIYFNEKMLLFLKDWLVRHIILVDRQYANYYKDQVVRLPAS